MTARLNELLVANVGAVSSIESVLRSLTWILPGRFHDAELASESLSALLNVLSMYHDSLMAKAAERTIQSNPRYRAIIPPSPHTRYTRAWSNRSSTYKWAARSLELIRFTQLLIEMGLKRTVTSQARWRVVMLVESLKVFLRLLLIRVSRRPLLSPPIPERDFDPATLPPVSAASSPTLVPSSPSSSPPATPEHLKNNVVPLPPHPLLASPPTAKTSSVIDEYLLPKALQPSDVKPAHAILRPLSTPQDWLSEILHIIRPLIYAIMLARDRKSSRALTTVLFMEIISRNLRRTIPVSATLEREEYSRRDRDIFWYALRGNIWESYTRPKLEQYAQRWATTPVVSVVSALMKDWIPLIDEYYYYTAP